MWVISDFGTTLASRRPSVVSNSHSAEIGCRQQGPIARYGGIRVWTWYGLTNRLSRRGMEDPDALILRFTRDPSAIGTESEAPGRDLSAWEYRFGLCRCGEYADISIHARGSKKAPIPAEINIPNSGGLVHSADLFLACGHSDYADSTIP
jgi:hypothetical protein